jgi:hypothetical protein
VAPSISIIILSSNADFDYSLAVGPEGQSRTFTLRGRISAPADPIIDGKPGTVTIREDDTEAEALRMERRACGRFLLFEDGKLDFGDAFRAWIHVKSEIAHTIDRAVIAAQIGGRMISIDLDVALEGLPNVPKYTYYSVAEGIDLRDERGGDILGFKLWPWSWKPGEIPPYLHEPAMELGVSLTEGGWWGMVPLGANMLSFRGIIDRSPAPLLIGRVCKVELREYHADLGERYPSAGTFLLQYDNPEITLLYQRSDFNDRIKSLLGCQRVWLSLKLIVDKEKLCTKLASIEAEDVTGQIASCAIGTETRIDRSSPPKPG